MQWKVIQFDDALFHEKGYLIKNDKQLYKMYKVEKHNQKDSLDLLV